MKSSISIVIPNYNGYHLLKQHLPAVIKHSNAAQIVIIDDASTDNSVAYIQKKYPHLNLIRNQQHLGFAASVNKGFQQASGDLILLLNTDVSINATTIKYLTRHFSDPKVFSVGSLEKLPQSKQRGKSQVTFQRGIFLNQPAGKLSFGPTAWTFGASSMYRKSLWQKLNGFDLLFQPAYYEDIDICFRAWKAGYRCLFDPRATVKHQAESTMNKYLGRQKNTLVFKNQLLFTWKHIDNNQFLIHHLLWLPYHLLITAFKTKGSFLFGFLAALPQLPRALSYSTSPQHLSSQQVLSSFIH